MTATPNYGHQISLRVEDPAQRARMAASGLRFKIAAVVLSLGYLAFLGVVAYRQLPDDSGDWSSIITGAVCGTALLFVVPWSIGANKRRKAGELLYLNGSRLTVAGAGGKPPRMLDLSRTRAEVRLDWLVDSDLINSKALSEAQRNTRIELVHKSIDRQIAKGVTPCIYAPLLILHAEEDGHRIPILLADHKTRRIRSAAEIHMLERAMQFAADPAIQHAAGQLRTIARWQRLPAIYEARPDTIPATPADHPATAAPIPTPVLRGEPAPEIVVTGNPGGRPGGGIVRA